MRYAENSIDYSLESITAPVHATIIDFPFRCHFRLGGRGSVRIVTVPFYPVVGVMRLVGNRPVSSIVDNSGHVPDNVLAVLVLS